MVFHLRNNGSLAATLKSGTGTQMAKTTIDVDSLFAVLEARTNSDGLSMRQAAALIGVSPSLLSRLRNGQRPDLDAFANIVRWLGVSADTFLISDDVQKSESVELN